MLQQCEEIPKFKINFWACEKNLLHTLSSSYLAFGAKRRWKEDERCGGGRILPFFDVLSPHMWRITHMFVRTSDSCDLEMVSRSFWWHQRALFSLPEGDGWSAVVFCGRSRHPDERNRWRRSLCSFAQNQVDFEACFILVSYWLQFIAN